MAIAHWFQSSKGGNVKFSPHGNCLKTYLNISLSFSTMSDRESVWRLRKQAACRSNGRKDCISVSLCSVMAIHHNPILGKGLGCWMLCAVFSFAPAWSPVQGHKHTIMCTQLNWASLQRLFLIGNRGRRSCPNEPCVRWPDCWQQGGEALGGRSPQAQVSVPGAPCGSAGLHWVSSSEDSSPAAGSRLLLCSERDRNWTGRKSGKFTHRS